jgi:DNA-binding MarR family transcriptional regulator
VTPLEPTRSPGFLLWHATLRWQRGIAAALAPLRLTHVQFVLLASTWWLNDRREQPTQAALAAHAGTDIKMTSQVIRTLEAKGLVERATDPTDTRARRLRVTRAGGRLAPRAIAAVEQVDAEFFAGIPPDLALDLLTRLAAGPAPQSSRSPAESHSSSGVGQPTRGSGRGDSPSGVARTTR